MFQKYLPRPCQQAKTESKFEVLSRDARGFKQVKGPKGAVRDRLYLNSETLKIKRTQDPNTDEAWYQES